ncbi:uncharacterized protein [Diadema setosum]|uniref:uncharacterized protein n=1 Tax=Diadema setosum TaxID=31175 RepID=UPI003B3B8A7B
MAKEVEKCVFVNPFYQEGVGRRTGIQLKKNVRKDSDGFDNFDDYWSESENDATLNATLADNKENLSRAANQGNARPTPRRKSSLKSMPSFSPQVTSSEREQSQLEGDKTGADAVGTAEDESVNDADITGSVIKGPANSLEPSSAICKFKTKKRLSFSGREGSSQSDEAISTEEERTDIEASQESSASSSGTIRAPNSQSDSSEGEDGETNATGDQDALEEFNGSSSQSGVHSRHNNSTLPPLQEEPAESKESPDDKKDGEVQAATLSEVDAEPSADDEVPKRRLTRQALMNHSVGAQPKDRSSGGKSEEDQDAPTRGQAKQSNDAERRRSKRQSTRGKTAARQDTEASPKSSTTENDEDKSQVSTSTEMHGRGKGGGEGRRQSKRYSTRSANAGLSSKEDEVEPRNRRASKASRSAALSTEMKEKEGGPEAENNEVEDSGHSVSERKKREEVQEEEGDELEPTSSQEDETRRADADDADKSSEEELNAETTQEVTDAKEEGSHNSEDVMEGVNKMSEEAKDIDEDEHASRKSSRNMKGRGLSVTQKQGKQDNDLSDSIDATENGGGIFLSLQVGKTTEVVLDDDDDDDDFEIGDVEVQEWGVASGNDDKHIAAQEDKSKKKGKLDQGSRCDEKQKGARNGKSRKGKSQKKDAPKKDEQKRSAAIAEEEEMEVAEKKKPRRKDRKGSQSSDGDDVQGRGSKRSSDEAPKDGSNGKQRKRQRRRQKSEASGSNNETSTNSSEHDDSKSEETKEMERHQNTKKNTSRRRKSKLQEIEVEENIVSREEVSISAGKAESTKTTSRSKRRSSVHFTTKDMISIEGDVSIHQIESSEDDGRAGMEIPRTPGVVHNRRRSTPHHKKQRQAPSTSARQDQQEDMDTDGTKASRSNKRSKRGRRTDTSMTETTGSESESNSADQEQDKGSSTTDESEHETSLPRNKGQRRKRKSPSERTNPSSGKTRKKAQKRSKSGSTTASLEKQGDSSEEKSSAEDQAVDVVLDFLDSYDNGRAPKQDSHRSFTPAAPSIAPQTLAKPLSNSILKKGKSKGRKTEKNRKHSLLYTEKPVSKAYIIAPELERGLRRTKRNRVRPLEYWRNERPLYERRKSGGFALSGVLSPEEKSFNSRGGRLSKQAKTGRVKGQLPLTPANISLHSSPPPGTEPITNPSVTVVNPDSDEEVVIDAVATSKMLKFTGPSGLPANKGDPITIAKALSQKAFSAGVLTIRPLQEKGSQLVRRDTMVFYVVRGKLAVSIHQTSHILQNGDWFFVPKGNIYNIKNLRRDEAKLTFFQHKGQ